MLFTTACITIFREVRVASVDAPASAATAQASGALLTVRSRAHLRDGSTVMFLDSVRITTSELTGAGMHYPLDGSPWTHRTRVPVDSVVAMETFAPKTLVLPSLIVSVAGTAVGALGAGVLAVAIFGSCPTVYSDTGAGPVLQAEGFSYAIAPVFEHPDLDPIDLRPDANGVLRFELRNEALETHFINSVAVHIVDHPAGSLLLPDQRGHPTLVDGLRAVRATDRAGRDVSTTLAAADSAYYATDPAVLAAVREQDHDDWIDLWPEALLSSDSIALVVRLRNSLLNTVLLYDLMLSGPGAASWLSDDLTQLPVAAELGRWYIAAMGLRVESFATGEPLAVARIGDVGPIAFREVAIVLPRAALGSDGRIRLRFAADNWRIDRVLLATQVAPAISRTLVAQRVMIASPDDASGRRNDAPAVAALAATDESYLQTLPGQRMWLEFDGEEASAGRTTSYLLAWQGWYREWIRGEWIARPASGPFRPGAASLVTAQQRWSERQASFERDFFASKVPVR